MAPAAAPPLPTPTAASAAEIRAAAQHLHHGGLVAMPTETVYGLAADATNPQAIATLYATKGRPAHNPLIIHVATLAHAQQLGVFNATALHLANAFWPGPLTLVVPRHTSAQARAICPGALAHQPTIALRIPAHPVAQALLAATGRPLAAPSANRSGHVSATLPSHIRADFGPTLPILASGPSPLGLESTVVECTTPTPRLLRPGSLTPAHITAVISPWGLSLAMAPNLTPPNNGLMSPGQLSSHYAPQAPLRLGATQHQPGNAWVTFGTLSPPNLPTGTPVRNLSPRANLAEAASQLFAVLRELDSLHPTAIAVVPLPTAGLGLAITDRITRAAAPK